MTPLAEILILIVVGNVLVWGFMRLVIHWQEKPQARMPLAPPPRRTVLRPQTAAVRPRIVDPKTGETFLLEDEIRPLLATGVGLAVRLAGGPGAGKTTALEHLMAVLPDDPRLMFFDNLDESLVPALARKHCVICTSERRHDDLDAALDFPLAVWERDDVIEYLLSIHEKACGSVMKRLGSELPLPYRGCPEIWRPILDTMAADPAIPNTRRALSNYLQWLEPDLQKFRATGRGCLNRLTASSPIENPEMEDPQDEFERLLRHPEVQVLVAAEQLAQDLQGPHPPGEGFLARNFPKPLVDETAGILAEDPNALLHILNLLSQPLKHYSLLVSILHAAEIDWEPEFHWPPDLSFASLDGICWPGVDLSEAVLDQTDFRNADLTRANLENAEGLSAKFRGANLAGASMISSRLPRADFSKADLSRVQAEDSCFEQARFCGANLQGASLPKCIFSEANLENANFSNADLQRGFLAGVNLSGACLAGADLSLALLLDAKLGDVDLTGANLEQGVLKGLCFREANVNDANFRNADMECCHLEGLRARNVNFKGAKLNPVAFTGSHLTNANFSHACLQGAKLADIDWEGADLRSADLQGATFHMGTTRSGLLFTGIASEGTRTGFYTDEFEEQSFRAPEDIRKANLRGADLRGAILFGVDFYLVDLRGAIYDSDQAEHFRRCGAIL